MVAAALSLLCAILLAAVVVFWALGLGPSRPQGWGTAGIELIIALLPVSFSAVGAAIALRQPTNAIGWVCLGIGLVFMFNFAADPYGSYGRITGSAPLPGAVLFTWLVNWTWVPAIGTIGTFLLLLFPDGRLLSPRWRDVTWLSAAVIVLASLGEAFRPGPLENAPSVQNPYGIGVAEHVPLRVAGGMNVLLALCFLAAAVSVVLRLRRARGRQRLQMKWFAFASGLLAVLLGLAVAGELIVGLLGFDRPLGLRLLEDAVSASAVGLPVAIAIAVLKHRLYDIDVVINKTVVFGALAAFITVVYVGVVVGIGALIGSGNEPNLGLSILATAIVAVAFQPVRERVQHLANRLVYGKRATPYEVLSEFSDRVAETYASEEVLPKMAKAIKEGTGAEHAEVWLRSHDELRAAAVWPQDTASDSQSLSLSDGRLPAFDDVDRAVEVRHQGELLGALTVTKPQTEPLTPAEDKLLSDLASQAGLVLRNVGLTSELLARLEELKASRQRLVAAQDEERRRLERNLHDGAQQHLVALKTRLSLAKRMTERDATKAAELLSKLEADADEALETLRDLARGIYPPLLAEQGLNAALEAHARKLPIPVEVQADNISRYDQEIEAAVYFCCLEALQNVSKYADASSAAIHLQEDDGALEFFVKDDGRGFDSSKVTHGSGLQNMSDRLAALGGTVAVRSSPGEGTTVSARIPVAANEMVA